MAPEPIEPTDRPAASAGATTYELVLYVSAGSTSSARALRQVQALCEAHLPGRYTLSLVDVHSGLELVGDRVLATPTLLRRSPGPERMVVGDFSDEQRVLMALGLSAAEPAHHGLDPPVGSGVPGG